MKRFAIYAVVREKIN